MLNEILIRIGGLFKTPEKTNIEPIQASTRRIVVYGSRMIGGQNVSQGLDDYIQQQGIEGIKIDWVRHTNDIHRGFFNQTEDRPDANNPPVGVVLLPEMRQEDEMSGTKMFIPTYGEPGLKGTTVADYVRRLCQENGVPLAEIRSAYEINQLQDQFRRLVE